MSNVVQLRRRPTQTVSAPSRREPEGEVYTCRAQGGGWLVIDVSASGGSAGMHGVFPTKAEADAEGRRAALTLNRVFVEDTTGGAA